MKWEERSAGHSLEAHAAVESVEDEQPVENEECLQAPGRAGAWKARGELLGSVVAGGIGGLSQLRRCVQTWQWQLAEDGRGIRA